MRTKSTVIQLKLTDNTPEIIEAYLDKYLNAGYKLASIFENNAIVFVVFTLDVVY